MDDQNKPDQPTPNPEPTGSPVPPPPPGSEPVPQPAEPGAASAQPTAPFGQPPAPGQPGAAAPQSPFAAQPAAPGQQPVAQPAAPGQQPGSQPQPGYYPPTAPQTSGKAVGSLVCGILAILFSGTVLLGIVLGIVAIVLAVKAVSEAGKDGKATGGKVCGIVGIVFSVITLVLYMVLGLGVLAYVNSYSEIEPYSGSSDTLSAVPGVSDSQVSGEEAAIEAAAAVELDKLKGKDAAVVQQLAAEADETLADATGYSLTDLGVDPIGFVEWLMTDFDYQFDGVTDYADGTGSAHATVTMRDSMAFATTFMEDAQAALDAGEMQGMDEAAAKARLGELYKAAMDKTTGMTDDYVTFDMVKVGDAWQVDDDSLAAELDYLFGL